MDNFDHDAVQLAADQSVTSYKKVPCKRCGMPTGQQCRTLATGRTTETHAVRHYDAGNNRNCWRTTETKQLSQGSSA